MNNYNSSEKTTDFNIKPSSDLQIKEENICYVLKYI